MKIYTKTGDGGQTSLYDGSRALKSSISFQVLGEIDELSARIGLLCSHLPETLILRKIQRTLQDFNSHIATIDKKNKKLPDLSEDLVTELEKSIDEMEKTNTKLTKFILPGVTESDAIAHLCRTQARKVERYLIELKNQNVTDIPTIIFPYMNRVSDFFFVFARWICHTSGKQDCFV
jgi:cob(I)alamin adenosyltransferase